jgi:glycerophosphoryl diester phosphodiesterase
MTLARVSAFAIALALSLSTSDAAETSSPKAGWNVRDHVPVEKFVVQSHRGAGELAPENTIDAFELGWKYGTALEADLRTTKDGVIVTFHDEKFTRVVRNLTPELKDKRVQDLTWDELSKLDVGAWKGDHFNGRRVSKVTDAFAAMKGKPERRMYLDIKNIDLKQLAKLVREYGVADRVTLASTKDPIIKEWHELVPESQTLLWMGGTEEQLEKRFAEWRKVDWKGVTQAQIHIRPKVEGKYDVSQPDPFKLSDAFLIKAGEEFRKHGILYQTLPWGSTEKEVYWKLMDLGAASFATDYPDVTMAAIREYYEQKKK